MKLSMKQKALIQSVGLVLGATLFGVFISVALTHIPMYVIPYIFVTFVICVAVYLIYKINLSHLEYRKALEEMTAKKD